MKCCIYSILFCLSYSWLLGERFLQAAKSAQFANRRPLPSRASSQLLPHGTRQAGNRCQRRNIHATVNGFPCPISTRMIMTSLSTFLCFVCQTSHQITIPGAHSLVAFCSFIFIKVDLAMGQLAGGLPCVLDQVAASVYESPSPSPSASPETTPKHASSRSSSSANSGNGNPTSTVSASGASSSSLPGDWGDPQEGPGCEYFEAAIHSQGLGMTLTKELLTASSFQQQRPKP